MKTLSKDTSDPGKALHLINQYKTENHKIVFTDLIFNGYFFINYPKILKIKNNFKINSK